MRSYRYAKLSNTHTHAHTHSVGSCFIPIVDAGHNSTRTLQSTLRPQVDEAEAVREEARGTADEARERERESAAGHAADVALFEKQLRLLRDKDRVECEQTGKVEALEVALDAAKVDMHSLRDAKVEKAALESRVRTATDAAATAAAQLQHERTQRENLLAATRNTRMHWARELRGVEEESAGALREAAAVLFALTHDVSVCMRQVAAAEERAHQQTLRQRESDAARQCAEAAEVQVRGQLARVQEELTHRDVGIRLAAEQVRRAEADWQAANVHVQQEQQRALSAESALSAAAAATVRLEAELQERAVRVASLEDALVASCTITSTSSTTSSSSSSTCAEITKATERERTYTSGELLGGEVAHGVGVMVTINNKEKETVRSLQTTIKEKEKEVNVIMCVCMYRICI